jgi:hypothetical protein
MTIKEINFGVFSFKHNTTSKELGDFRWPYEIGVFPNVSPTSTRDEDQGSNLFGTLSNKRSKSHLNYDLFPQRIKVNNELVNHNN